MSHRRLGQFLAAVALTWMSTACIFAVEGAALDDDGGAGMQRAAAAKGQAKPGEQGAAKAADESAEATAEAAAAKERAKARKAEKRAHDLELARVELEVAEIEAQSGQLSAEIKLDNARRELDEARRALEHFKGRLMPRELEDGRLDLDRAMQNKTEAEQELREMEATYAKDQFAKDTKELVLMRHRKRVEFSTRGLAIAQAEFTDKEQVDLPKRLRELETKLRTAEQAARDADVALQKQALRNKLDLARKRWSILELERPDDEAEGESKGEQKKRSGP